MKQVKSQPPWGR